MRPILKSDEQLRRMFPRVTFVDPPEKAEKYTGSDVDMMVFDLPCPLTESTIRLAYAWLSLQRRPWPVRRVWLGPDEMATKFPVHRCRCPKCGFLAAILYGSRWRCKCGAEHAVLDTKTTEVTDADR